MRILILSQYAGSPSLGMVFRNHVLAKAWMDLGHEVTIVASSFSHARARQPNMKSRLIRRETVDAVPYLWVWGPRYAARSAPGRVFGMLVFTALLYTLRLARLEPNIVVASSPSPFVVYPAHAIARRSGAKLIFDIRDLWPLTLTEVGGISRSNPLVRVIQGAEDFACRKSDLVVSVPRNAASYLEGRGLHSTRFLHIGNGFLLEDGSARPSDSQQSPFRRPGGEGTFVFGYAGAFGTANALDLAIVALATADARTHLALLGEGEKLDELRTLASTLGLENRVHFLPAVARNRIGAFLSSIDVAYLGLKKSALFTLGVSPTKLNDYMLAGKPVLYAVGDPNNAVAASGGGIACEPESLAISSAMDLFAATPTDTLHAMGGRGRAWCLENNSALIQAQRILDTLAAAS